MLIDTSIQLIGKEKLIENEVPSDYVQLNEIMKLIKGGTAYSANKLLSRKGSFWSKDSYDHYIRDEKEFNRILAYIISNPVSVGLVNNWEDYEFTYVAPEFL